jgi:hypothetical protein
MENLSILNENAKRILAFDGAELKKAVKQAC